MRRRTTRVVLAGVALGGVAAGVGSSVANAAEGKLLNVCVTLQIIGLDPICIRI